MALETAQELATETLYVNELGHLARNKIPRLLSSSLCNSQTCSYLFLISWRLALRLVPVFGELLLLFTTGEPPWPRERSPAVGRPRLRRTIGSRCSSTPASSSLMMQRVDKLGV